MSSHALELTRRLYVAGVALEMTSENTIRLSGQPASEDLVAELKVQKVAVLALMSAQRIGTRDDGFASGETRRYVLPPSCLADGACARLGPCSQHLMQRSCGRPAPEDDRSLLNKSPAGSVNS